MPGMRMQRRKWSAADFILLGLGLTLGGAGAARAILAEAGKALDRYLDRATAISDREQRFRVALTRLSRDNLIERTSKGMWKLTARGKVKSDVLRRVTSYCDRTRSGERDTLVIFDVPKQLGKKRFWLRAELVALDFSPLQRSVWIGDGPIPEEFVAFLRDTNLLPHVHIFSIRFYGTLK